MRMLSKSVQLHLSTYIPSSPPSCRNLLMAYSVLEGERGKGRKSSYQQEHSKPHAKSTSLSSLKSYDPITLPVLGTNVSDMLHEASWDAEEP